MRRTFFILDTYHPDILYIWASTYVWVRGYFEKPEEVREQKRLGHTKLDHNSRLRTNVHYIFHLHV
jgi:hypothetical protein